MINAALALDFGARHFGDRDAIVDPDASLSYRGLDRYAQQIAQGLLCTGMEAGSHVGLIGHTSRHFVAALFGIYKAGMVAVPINNRLRVHQFTSLLDFADTAACLIVESPDAPPLISEAVSGALAASRCKFIWVLAADPIASLPPATLPWTNLTMPLKYPVVTPLRHPEDTAVLSFTSGTTGQMRAAMLSHNSALLPALSNHRAFGIGVDDIVLSTIGLFTGFGRDALLNSALCGGATLVFLPIFEPERVVSAIRRNEATCMLGVPAMFDSLRKAHLDGIVDLTTLQGHWRSIIYGGAPMRRDLRAFYGEDLGIATVQGYGLTESNSIGVSPTGARPGLGTSDPLCPVWGQVVRIVDESGADVPIGDIGEVVAQGPAIMSGYYKAPEESARVMKDGWLHTGDQARSLPNGEFDLLGRGSDSINRGGYMVYPSEIELVLVEHPAVEAAAVKGIPDERLGEEIAAYIVTHNDQEQSVTGLAAWAKVRLADFQCPRHFVFMQSLPTGPTGKINKGELPDIFGRTDSIQTEAE